MSNFKGLRGENGYLHVYFTYVLKNDDAVKA